MKSIKIILLVIFSILVSCNKKQEQKENKRVVIYNIDEFFKNKNKNVKIIDTFCINEEKRALADIKSGKLVYFFFMGMTMSYRSNKEMKQILSKYNIQIDSALSYCTPMPKGFRRNCYAVLMDHKIEEKYGDKFIDSLRVLAEKQFAINNPNFVFPFDECDTISSYPGPKNYSDFFDKPEKDFSKMLVYPKGYQHKNEKDFSSAEVSFILNKNGTISNIVTDCSFANSKNEKFDKYFKTNAENFVKRTKWIPAKFSGIPVNSKIHFIYFYK